MKINCRKSASSNPVIICCYLLVLLLPILQLHAQSVEEVQVNISPLSLTVKNILQQVASQSGVNFVYTRSFADVNKTISLDNNRNTLKSLFLEIREKTGLEFIVSGKQVVIREKDSKASPEIFTLAGIVTAETERTPLYGVTVHSPRQTVTTGQDGRFSVLVAKKDPVTFSYIGMQTAVIKAGTPSGNIAIALQVAVNDLSQVVVTGYQEQKKADLTGAVSVVDVNDMKDIPLGNPMKALQGRVPGMLVTGDGLPNGSMTVRIRGIGTMNNNDPLYVIDGVPTKRGLEELNPNDIASIQVLKDASSATIYGSRAANGVIIVTTKKARKRFSRIDIDASSSLQFYNNMPKPLDTEGRGLAYWQGAVNDKADPNLNQIYQFDWNKDFEHPVLYKIILPEYIDAAKITRAANTNWFREITQTSAIQSLNLSLSSGSEKGTTMLSVGYYDNRGIVKETGAGRMTMRLNTEYNLFNDKLKFGENFSGSYIRNSLVDYWSALGAAMIQQPIVPVHTEDGGWGGPAAGMKNSPNPLRVIEDSKQNKSHFYRALGNAYADWNIIPNLFFKSSVGVDFTGLYERTLRKSYTEGSQSDPSNQVMASQAYTLSWLWQNTLNYTLKLDQHRFDFLLGHEQIKYNEQDFSAGRQGYALENIDYSYLDAGSANQTNAGKGTGYALLSYFGKINYAFADKYLASATLRRDGSSRFGKDNRYGTFPAFSLGWRLSEEPFMKALPAISDLKLRYGWGKTGNQEIADNAAYSLYASVYSSTPYSLTGTAYDIGGNGTGQLPSGFRLVQTGNNALRWESTMQSNFGVDFALFNNTLSGAVDYYTKKTSDILVKPPYLAVIGDGGDKYYNGAAMQNKGWEMLLSYKGHLSSNLFFSLTGNVASFRNKVTYLPDDVVTAYGGNGTDKTILGRPYQSIFGYVADGLFQSQKEVDAYAEQPGKGVGRIRYKDLNGDNVINYLDQDFIASPYPDFTYGLNVALKYKAFDLAFFLQGVQGIDQYNYNKTFTDFASITSGANWGTRTLEAWSPANTGASIPALTLVNRNGEDRSSTYYIENGSYLKLRNIQLGYDLKTVMKRSKTQKARIYLEASNILTVKSKHFTAADPENSDTAFPIPAVATLGFNFSF